MLNDFFLNLSVVDYFNYTYMFVILFCTIYCTINTISNEIAFIAYNRKFILKDEPSVDILIPARNESKGIEKTLRGILNQTYKNYKVYLIDDNSEDNTYEIAQKFSNDKRFTVIKSKPLPPHWKGKQNALQQLLKISSGEYVITIDADMVAEVDFVNFLVSRLVMLKGDLISGWPQHYFGGGKNLWLMPIPYLMQFLMIPIWTMPWTPSSKMGFAAGGFIGYKREKLESVGGYESVANIILEDVYMARTFKKKKYKVYFIDGKKHLKGDWFMTYQDSVRGFSRMATNYFENKVVDMLFTMFYFFMHHSLLPVVLILNIIFMPPFWYIYLICYLVIKTYWIYNIMGRGFKFNWRFLFPEISFLFIIYVFGKSILLQKKGLGYVWKSRTVINE